jgi:hypothetical protein
MSKYKIVKRGECFVVQELIEDVGIFLGVPQVVDKWKNVNAISFLSMLRDVGIKVPEGIKLSMQWPYSPPSSSTYVYHKTIDSANLLCSLLREYANGGIYTDITKFLPHPEGFDKSYCQTA